MDFKLNGMEQTILDCIFQGKSNSEISEILKISKSETIICVEQLCRMFGVKNRLQLILKYYL